MRESINDAIFELFTRSVSTASSKKQNSLILFILNMREFKSSRVGILTILLDTYSKLRSLAKKFIPSYSAAHNRLLAQLNGEENQRLTAKISEYVYYDSAKISRVSIRYLTARCSEITSTSGSKLR